MNRLRKLMIALLVFTAGNAMAQKYVGGDISLLPSYEQNGATYFDNNGNPIAEVLPYLKQQGLNAMRVRLFVNPANAPETEKEEGVRQDLGYVKKLAKRIKEQGVALMLDFHYSDSWADPSKQYTPNDWQALTESQLQKRIYTYTKDALQQLADTGATPDFIQTGNEISYGMLWGARGASDLKKCYTSSTDNWPYFTSLLKQAIKACREVCPQAKVILHTERVAQPTVLKDFYQRMASYGVDYDIIGLSYYPYFHGNLSQLNTALNTLEKTYADKDIMLVETGYYHDWQPSTVDYDLSAQFPITGEGQKAFASALISTLSAHKSVKGLFWWFLEANEKGLDWSTKHVTASWYNAGLFDNSTGKAEPALYVLKDFLGTADAISTPTLSTRQSETKWYNLCGQRISQPDKSTIAICQGKKIRLAE